VLLINHKKLGREARTEILTTAGDVTERKRPSRRGFGDVYSIRNAGRIGGEAPRSTLRYTLLRDRKINFAQTRETLQ